MGGGVSSGSRQLTEHLMAVKRNLSPVLKASAVKVMEQVEESAMVVLQRAWLGSAGKTLKECQEKESHPKIFYHLVYLSIQLHQLIKTNIIKCVLNL